MLGIISLEINFMDDFFHLSFTNQLAVAMRPDILCPLDSERMIGEFPKGISCVEIGNTTDTVVIRLMKMHMKRQQNIAVLKEVDDSDPNTWPSTNEISVISYIAAIRLGELFPQEAYNGSVYHLVSLGGNSSSEVYKVYKTIELTSVTSSNPPS